MRNVIFHWIFEICWGDGQTKKVTCPWKYLAKGSKSPSPWSKKNPCKYSARDSHLNSAWHNLVVQLCLAQKNLTIVFRLFSKFAHSFVDIELLTFPKNPNFHFYCLRELSVFEILKKSVGKQDWFFFATCAYIKIFRKKEKLYINLNYNDCHTGKTTCTCIYTQKAKKLWKRFYIQKSRQFTLRNFHENFEAGIVYKKYDTLRYVTFLYT